MSVGPHCARDDSLELVEVGRVGDLDRDRACQRGRGRGDGFEVRATAAGDDDVCAFRGEPLGRGRSDPGSATGDDDDLVREAAHARRAPPSTCTFDAVV